MTMVTATNNSPMDSLAGGLAQLARYDNVNTNQILTVAGAIEPERLLQAVHRAVGYFPLLLSRPTDGGRAIEHEKFHPSEIPFTLYTYRGRCDFGDPVFRQMLMNFSANAHIDWRERVPIQICLVVAADKASSCLYMNTSHAVADAKSDCLLLARILAEYAGGDRENYLCAKAGHPVHEFESLQRIRPAWYRPVRRWRRAAVAMISILYDLVRFDVGFPVIRRADASADTIDFHHAVLSPAIEASIKQAARRHEVTFNTLFCAALIRAIERLGGRRRGWARIVCAISLRRLIEERFSDTFRNYLVPSRLRFPLGRDTAQLLSAVAQEVKHAREVRVEIELGRLEWIEPLLKWSVLRPLTRRLIARSIGTNACYSNPGIIEEDFSCFGDPSLPTLQYAGFGCLVHPFDFILYTPTVDGRIQLDLIFRKNRFADVEAEFITPYREELSRLLADLGCDPSENEASPDQGAGAQPQRAHRAMKAPNLGVHA